METVRAWPSFSLVVIGLGCALTLLAQADDAVRARAIGQLQRGDAAGAASTLEGQLKRTPNDAELWNLLGVSRAELKQSAQARAAFEHGLKLAPGDASLFENLGLLYYEASDYANAQSALGSALRAGSTKPGVAFSYAASLLRTGNEADGLSMLRKLESALTLSGDYWTERGWAELHTDAQLADSSFEHALALSPADPRALNGAASAAESLKDEERALALLIRARKAAPGDVRTLLHFGTLCLRRDLTVDAMDALDRAYHLAPNNNLALFLYARAQIALQQWGKAYDLFLEYDRRVPNYAAAQYALGWLSGKLNQMDKAREYFERALRLAPAHTEARYELAAVLIESGQEKDGEAQLLKVLEQAPEHVKANVAYGNLLARKGQLELARARYERAIAADAKYGPAHYKLSVVLQRLHFAQLADTERQAGVALNEEAEKAGKTVLVLTEPDGRQLAGEMGSVRGIEK